MKLTASFVFCLLGTTLAGAQAPSPGYTDAKALMDAVAKTCAAGAETYHLESITESVRNNELTRQWDKSLHTVIKGLGNRFRFEARTGYGTWMQDSDGTTEWAYLREANVYVKRAAEDKPQFPKVYGMGTQELKQAWDMLTFLDARAEHAKNATLLPEETIEVEGHSYPCYVVHATSEREGLHSEQTYWIEKKTLMFRKVVEHNETLMTVSPILKIPLHEEVTTLYPVVELNPQIDSHVFTFKPPADAKEVAALEPMPTGFTTPPASQMAGKPAPDISLAAADGREVKLSSLRGQPVLIDVWATWCGACLEWMPSLAKLEKEMNGKGLQVISVDQDEVAQNAAHYLAVHGFTWPNYHDGERKLGRAFGEKSIPLTVLIDAQGKVTYVGTDSNEASLRKAIADLHLLDAASSR